MILYFTDKFAGGRDESHVLLEKALAVHTGDEQRAKILTGALKKGEHGKPYIDGFSCFSISHTGRIWAVLIADPECGLDIQLGRKCDMKAIAERWFAPEDTRAVASRDDFFRIWTRREALTKAIGGTVYDPDLPSVLTEEAEINGDRYAIRDIHIPDMPELYAAVCIHKGGSVPELSFTRI